MFSRCCPGGLLSGLLLMLVATGAFVLVRASLAQEDSPPAVESASASADTEAGDTEPGEVHANAPGADAGHGDEPHLTDSFDIGHNNAGPNQEAVIDLRSDLAVFTAVVFLLLLAILGKFAWNPIVGGLDKREKAIERLINETRESAEKANSQLRAYEAQLAAAADETRELLAQAHRDAESTRERILAEAERAAQRQRERALSDIRAATNVALGEVAQKGAEIAVNLAGQIVRRELRPEDHTQIIQDSLDRFPSNN